MLKTMPHSHAYAARSGCRVRAILLCALLVAAIGICGCATGGSRALEGPTASLASSGSFAAASKLDMAAQFHVLAGEMAIQRGMTEAAAQHYVKALEYTNNLKLAKRATRIALFSGQRELAYKAVQEWARLAPDSNDAQRTATRLALVQGDAEAVLGYGRAVLVAAATLDEGYRLLADVLSGAPAHGELAVASMRQLANQHAKSASAWYALGLVSLRYGQLQTAAEAAGRSVELAPSWDQAALLKAAILIRREKPTRAQAVIDALPGSQSQRSQYHLSLARLLLDGGQSAAALDEFERALSLQPDNANARYGLAVLALRQGKLQRAEAAFEHMYEADERTDKAAFYLGTLHERRGAYVTAERWYRRVDGGGHALDAKISVARMLAKQGSIHKAREKIDQLRRKYPETAARLSGAEARILVSAGRYSDALAAYNSALASNAGNHDLLYGRSLVYKKLGRIEQAIADLKKVLEQNPKSARALNALGYLLTNHKQRYQKALTLVTKALELDPGNPAILDSLGWVHYRLGHLNKSLDYLQQAYEKFPDPEVAAHLGEVLWQLGQKERARHIWQESLADHPGNKTLRKIMAQFTS